MVRWLTQASYAITAVLIVSNVWAEGPSASLAPVKDGLVLWLDAGDRAGQSKAATPIVAIADRFGDSSVTAPKAIGSHASRLVRVLLDDELHRREVQMSEEHWKALVTWIDANGPYHDRFFNKRPADGVPTRNVVPSRFSASAASTPNYQE